MRTYLLLTCLSLSAAQLAFAAGEQPISINSFKSFTNETFSYPQQAVRPIQLKIPNINPFQVPPMYTEEEVREGNRKVRAAGKPQAALPDSAAKSADTGKTQTPQNQITEKVIPSAANIDKSMSKDVQPTSGQEDPALSSAAPSAAEDVSHAALKTTKNPLPSATDGNENDLLPVREDAEFEDDEPQIKGIRKTYSDISEQVDDALAETRTMAKSAPAGKVKLNTSPKVVITPGVNEYLPIAKNHVNRIVTPFVSPSITSVGLSGGNAKDGTCGEICVKGNVIYVSTDKNDPVSMFITEQGSEEQAISITIVPQNIPPREVFLELSSDASGSKAASASLASDNLEAESFEKSLPYVEAIRLMMRSVALGEVPSGYVLSSARGSKDIPSCRQSGLSFNFKDGQRLTGHNLDLFIGVVRNVSGAAIEFNEMSCGSWQTAAVASYPLHVLQPGDLSEVYVVIKEARKPAPKPERPSLIPRNYGYR